MTAVDTLTLMSDDNEAVIARRGAEPLAWRAGGRDLLWTADPAVWARTSPVLFPIVGWARGGEIRVDGRGYPIGVHGFGADLVFSITERTGSSVTLVASDDESTRASYPFPFRLQVRYALAGATLAACFRVENIGQGEMPYAIGFHPGFAWPFAAREKAGHAVEFDQAEDDSVPAITAGGLFSDMRRKVALQGKKLPLTEDLLAREALCFLDARSRKVRFVGPDGAAIVVETEDFPHIALWSRPGAPFLSIETWTGHGDPDGFTGDLFDKPSMRRLAPGGVADHAVTMSFAPAAAKPE